MTIIDVFKFSAENGSLTFVKDKLQNVSAQGIYKSEFRYTLEPQFALLMNFFYNSLNLPVFSMLQGEMWCKQKIRLYFMLTLKLFHTQNRKQTTNQNKKNQLNSCTVDKQIHYFSRDTLTFF